jgi:type III polyketide synthase
MTHKLRRIKKLLRINRTTGIETRSSVLDFETGWGTEKNLPSIAEMDILFRTTGVDMAAQACTEAIDDWEGEIEGITHTVAVTCTNQGNPGFDLLVNEKLGLSSSVDRTLLHGVGCAGGLAVMRTAAQLACGSTMRGRPARILCYACEVTTSNAAAAFVLCNDMGLQIQVKPIYELLDWDVALIPGTKDELAYYADADGTTFLASVACNRRTLTRHRLSHHAW